MPQSLLPVAVDLCVGPQCCRQCLIGLLLTPSPNRHLNLLETGRVVCRPELHLDPDCCNEVSCNDIGRRPVFMGRLSWVWKGQYRLFYWQAGDPYLQ